MNKENFRAYLAWIMICIVWGTTYLAIRVGVEHLPPMLFAGFRWIIAGSIFMTFLYLRGKHLPSKKEVVHLGIMGLLLLGGGNGLVVVAEQWIPSGLTALIITTIPFWIIGLETFFPDRPKLNLTSIAGLILGLLGILLIFGRDISTMFNSSYIVGIISLLAAEFFWALGTLYSKHKKISVHPLMGASVQMLVAGVVLTLLGTSLGEFSVFTLETNSTLALLYLIFAGSIIGYGSYIYAVAHLPLSLVSTYAYINPVIALFLGWLILNEHIDSITIVASVIVFAGVALVKRGDDLNKKKIRAEIVQNEK
ncbi:MAG: EamA family transporter [Ignavibacteriales bacterium]|nr:MAG: EamA family transporter [Ignavibacteriales bacterium]